MVVSTTSTTPSGEAAAKRARVSAWMARSERFMVVPFWWWRGFLSPALLSTTVPHNVGWGQNADTEKRGARPARPRPPWRFSDSIGQGQIPGGVPAPLVVPVDPGGEPRSRDLGPQRILDLLLHGGPCGLEQEQAGGLLGAEPVGARVGVVLGAQVGPLDHQKRDRGRVRLDLAGGQLVPSGDPGQGLAGGLVDGVVVEEVLHGRFRSGGGACAGAAGRSGEG